MRTREKIKVTAIELFNEFGATNISTIKLSNHMDISPGNYYYYFSSKEDLIKAIWEENIHSHSEKVFFEKKYAPTVNGILDFANASIDHIYKFRFFYTELYILQKNDPKLRDAYKNHLIRSAGQAAETFAPWEAAGILSIPKEEEEKERLLQNMWIIAMTSMGFLQNFNPKMSGKKIKSNVKQQLYSLLYSSFSPTGREELKKLFE